MRQIVLDTETTGLDPKQGHRIIEIGCVEMNDRRLTSNNFHQYLLPDRKIDAAAIEVHGITNEFLLDKPRFKDVVQDFIEYIRGAELIIHNAPFDVGFLDNEFKLCKQAITIGELATVTDTLTMARRLHPGQRNSLDALCKRYEINNSHRTLHGALLDSEILADVYLGMTGGQTALSLDSDAGSDQMGGGGAAIRRLSAERPALRVVSPSEEEQSAHALKLDKLGESCLWRK
ncbi:MAG: DNA polymerase III subunit epsilon [Candidatus Polarisedimenticolaceae bacterium]|nr:DNA polymerase III subunit epsilon [Candidatus Polarisedimenticolaceae bacterium]